MSKLRGPIAIPKPRYIAEVNIDTRLEFADWYAARDWEVAQRLELLVIAVFKSYSITEREIFLSRLKKLLNEAGPTLDQILELSRRTT